MGEIIIRYLSMPCSIEACTAKDSNDDYNIYINSNLSFQEQEKAKQHELSHIQQNHFYSNKSAAVCESEV